MRERALLVGGQLGIWSEPGHGTRIELTDRLMRILVADDHGIVRAGIKLLLERQPGLDVVAEAGDGIEAVEQALAVAAGPLHPRCRNAATDGAAGGAGDPLASASRPAC